MNFRPAIRIHGVPAALLALAVIGVTACGGDDDDGEPAKEPARAPGKATTLRLKSPGGANKYDKKRLSAPAGRVTIEFTNDAERPHNVIVIPGDELDYKKKAVLSTPAISRDIGETKIEGSGELAPGTYLYYCSVQNHAALGMVGKLVIR